MRYAVFIIVLSSVIILGFITSSNPDKWSDETPVSQFLWAMGMDKPMHYIETIDEEKARMGKEIVTKGRTERTNGKMSNYVSKYFVCTDCHNQVQEDPVLNEFDPQARLDYCVENKLPFLQATTFWGMVNRKSWYNDDYILKYGDLVKPASENLNEATKLCAIECSSGRPLEEWEQEAITHYYWTLQLTMGDLNLSEKEWRKINILSGSEMDRKELIALVESKFMTASNATFVDPPYPLGTHYQTGKPGDAMNGEKLYDASCVTCHNQFGPSQLVLDKSIFTKRKFRNNIEKDTDFNLYKILRKGTYAQPGHMQYMPHYTAQRMSDQQVEDLRAFIEN